MKTLNSTYLMILAIITVFVFMIFLAVNQNRAGFGFSNSEAPQVQVKASDVILAPEEINPANCQQCLGETSGVNDNRKHHSADWGSMGYWLGPSDSNTEHEQRLFAEM